MDEWGGSFVDRVVVVTGAGTGLGATLARRFAAAGARLALVARSDRSLAAGSAAARAVGGDPLALAADVTSADDLARVAATVEERWGGADVLVNTAFPASRGGRVLDLDAAGLEGWRQAAETGGYGTLLACRFLVPPMVAKGRGAVVNVTSMSSRVGHAGRSEYAAGKVQAHRIAQALAEEVGPDGVRVNCVAPGHIWSDVLERWYRGLAAQRGVTYETVLAEITREMALRRIVTEDEVANAVLFLASDLATGITGAVIDVNAGHYFAA